MAPAAFRRRHPIPRRPTLTESPRTSVSSIPDVQVGKPQQVLRYSERKSPSAEVSANNSLLRARFSQHKNPEAETQRSGTPLAPPQKEHPPTTPSDPTERTARTAPEATTTDDSARSGTARSARAPAGRQRSGVYKFKNFQQYRPARHELTVSRSLSSDHQAPCLGTVPHKHFPVSPSRGLLGTICLFHPGPFKGPEQLPTAFQNCTRARG